MTNREWWRIKTLDKFVKLIKTANEKDGLTINEIDKLLGTTRMQSHRYVKYAEIFSNLPGVKVDRDGRKTRIHGGR